VIVSAIAEASSGGGSRALERKKGNQKTSIERNAGFREGERGMG